jgi:hypothetical protein
MSGTSTKRAHLRFTFSDISRGFFKLKKLALMFMFCIIVAAILDCLCDSRMPWDTLVAVFNDVLENLSNLI